MVLLKFQAFFAFEKSLIEDEIHVAFFVDILNSRMKLKFLCGDENYMTKRCGVGAILGRWVGRLVNCFCVSLSADLHWPICAPFFSLLDKAHARGR